MSLTTIWQPSKEDIESSNIYKMMQHLNFDSYDEFYKWSIENRADFWHQTIDALKLKFDQKYNSILDLSKGYENPIWLKDAKLNIVDSCFQNDQNNIIVKFKDEFGHLQLVKQIELETLVNRIANSLRAFGVEKGDYVAIDTPMHLEAVAFYLAAIKAGNPVVTIADSFSPEEIETRLKITNPKVIFTQDYILRAEKSIPLFEKVVESKAPKAIVLKKSSDQPCDLRKNDIYFNDFLISLDTFESVIQQPDEIITVLFSSGTTGSPKAIPWTHSTVIKCASDAYYHHNIQKNDVLCWPTNLGWMMGPWLVFASLINKSCIALFEDSPLTKEFGSFVEASHVTMLGVVPSIVKNWKSDQSMESFNWDMIKCFSSTGEVSNPNEMKYLSQLANGKPIIEYCGGTEIGGGYVTSTIVQPNVASTFSTQALGSSFVLIDENQELTDEGEVFLIPPSIGLSNTLLNKNHHDVYFKDTPKYKNIPLRRHGDALVKLKNGYYKALGRTDDAMNLGGIKVSAVQIEEVIQKINGLKEVAAVGIPPEDGGPNQLIIFFVKNKKILSIDELLKSIRLSVKQKINPLFKVEEIIEIDSLPRTASGKIMRRKLRSLYQENK